MPHYVAVQGRTVMLFEIGAGGKVVASSAAAANTRGWKLARLRGFMKMRRISFYAVELPPPALGELDAG